MKKINNNSRKKRSSAKNVSPWHEEYYNYGFGKMVPVNDAYLEKFGLEMVEWAKKQKTEKKPLTCLEDFYEYKDIDVKTVSRWRKRNEVLERCAIQTMTILGNLRENGVNRREFAPTLIEKTMYLHKPHFDEVDRRWATLREQEKDDKKRNITVIMSPLQCSEMPSAETTQENIEEKPQDKKNGAEK